MFSKKLTITRNGIIFTLVAIVLVALGAWLGSTILNRGSDGDKPSPYSVVYLSDGGIYFGKLSWFPKPHIASPWTIQRQAGEDGKIESSIVPVNKAIWSPVDEIYLNEKQIVAWSALRADGEMAKAMANPELLRSQGGQAQAGGQNQPQNQQPPAKPAAI